MTTQPIPSTTDDLIAEIEAAAKAATPGEREWVEDRFNGGWSGLYAGDEPVIVPQCRNEGDTGAAWFADEADADECGLSDGDRQFMEATSPANVLALIAHIRELEDVLRMYSLPIGGDLNQDCAEFGGDAVHREIMRRTVLGLPKVTPP